jgi:hypothetical protein
MGQLNKPGRVNRFGQLFAHGGDSITRRAVSSHDDLLDFILLKFQERLRRMNGVASRNSS